MLEKQKPGKINIYERLPDDAVEVFSNMALTEKEFEYHKERLAKLTVPKYSDMNKDNTIWIDLGKKNYEKKEVDYREIEGFDDKPNFKIPISLQLIYDNNRILCKIDKSQASFLERECTRALYFLLNKDGEEMFVFEKKNN